jgi:hypothetical protein
MLFCYSCANSDATIDSYALGGIAGTPTVSPWENSDGDSRFEVVERIGSGRKDLVFGRIGAVAAAEDGRLAIFDVSECRVHVVGVDRSSVVSFGSCGDGPGELRDVIDVEFVGDTVITLSAASATLQFFGMSGIEGRRMSLADNGITGASSFAAIDDSTLAVARTVRSSERDSTRSGLIVLVDHRTRRVRRDLLRIPDASASNPNVRGEFIAVCSGKFGRRRVLVAGQMWALQTVVLDASTLFPLGNYLSTSDWTGGVEPDVPGRSGPELRPRLRSNQVQCLRDATLTWARKTDWSTAPPSDRGSLVEIRDESGTPLYRGGNPAGVDENARPAASWGDRIAYISNHDTPEVIVARFHRLPRR